MKSRTDVVLTTYLLHVLFPFKETKVVLLHIQWQNQPIMRACAAPGWLLKDGLPQYLGPRNQISYISGGMVGLHSAKVLKT